MNTHPKIGLALGAGAAHGWCHIGVLRELEAMDIRPDVIAGASMGALVGAVHANGALDRLEDWALELTAAGVMGLLDIRIASGGLVEGAEILSKIRDFVGEVRIEALDVPLAVVATDMETGQEVWLKEGDVACAVRASVSLPGLLSPTLIDDRWMLDGGLTNPVPVQACRSLGADVVIGVNPNCRSDGIFWRAGEADLPGWRDRLPDAVSAFFGSYEGRMPNPGYLETLSTSLNIMMDEITQCKLAACPPDVLLAADLSDMSLLQFQHAAEAIEEGRRVVRASAERLESLARG